MSVDQSSGVEEGRSEVSFRGIVEVSGASPFGCRGGARSGFIKRRAEPAQVEGVPARRAVSRSPVPGGEGVLDDTALATRGAIVSRRSEDSVVHTASVQIQVCSREPNSAC